jgi:hypothetical protein
MLDATVKIGREFGQGERREIARTVPQAKEVPQGEVGREGELDEQPSLSFWCGACFTQAAIVSP